MENMNKVDFKVPLSGSTLFDIHTMYTAKRLCEKFPGLVYEVKENEIRFSGELNDYWFEQWNKALFQIGEND